MRSILLSRLYNAALRYFMLKETGEPESHIKAEQIRSEMFAALLDVHDCDAVPVEGQWYDAGQIHFDLKANTFRYEPPGG